MHRPVALLIALSFLLPVVGMILPVTGEEPFPGQAFAGTPLGTAALPFAQLDRCIEKDNPLSEQLSVPATNRVTDDHSLYCCNGGLNTSHKRGPAFGGNSAWDNSLPFSVSSPFLKENEYSPPGGTVFVFMAFLLYLVFLSLSNLPLPGVLGLFAAARPGEIRAGSFLL